jgi:hypothetical protein
MSYEHLGNMPEGFEHEQREIQPVGLIVEPQLVMKLYQMFAAGKPLDPGYMSECKGFIKEQVRSGNVEPYIGLGFAKLGKEIINVARWDDELPIELKNQVFRVRDGNLSTAEEVDIREVGAFCLWELGFVNHEKEAWKRYLVSQQTEADKTRYLEDFMEGLL